MLHYKLVTFFHICAKHGIKATLFAGTLLGSVRHGGMIPWDDDADVAVTSDDMERLYFMEDELPPCFFWRWYIGHGGRRFLKMEHKPQFVLDGPRESTLNDNVTLDIFGVEREGDFMVPQVRFLHHHKMNIDWHENMSLGRFGPHSFPVMSGAAEYLARAYGADYMTHVHKFNHTQLIGGKEHQHGVGTFVHLAPSGCVRIPRECKDAAPPSETFAYWNRFYSNQKAPSECSEFARWVEARERGVAPLKLLDIGCGNGRDTVHLSMLGRAKGVDLVPPLHL